MVNREKVILMTHMAQYAEREGTRDAEINQYFRSDYLSFQIVKSVICSTILYFLIIGFCVVVRFESFWQDLFGGGFGGGGILLLVGWLILTAIYSWAAYVVYSHKYKQMRRRIRAYCDSLEKLEELYERKL